LPCKTGPFLTEINEYFSYFQRENIRSSINQDLQRVPSIFYAVATNDMKIIKTWVDFGADVNALDKRYSVPLHAFAIINSSIIKQETTEAFAFLLASGAKPSTIPSSFSESCLGDMAVFNSVNTAPSTGANDIEWCKAFFWDKLSGSLNVTQRYLLSRTRRYTSPSIRLHQAATRYNVQHYLDYLFG
jgi:hypothetical protein